MSAALLLEMSLPPVPWIIYMRYERRNGVPPSIRLISPGQTIRAKCVVQKVMNAHPFECASFMLPTRLLKERPSTAAAKDQREKSIDSLPLCSRQIVVVKSTLTRSVKPCTLTSPTPF